MPLKNSTSHRLGVFAGLTGAAVFSTMALFVHSCGPGLKTGDILLARGIAGITVLSIMCWRELPLLFSRQAGFIWLRGLFGGISAGGYYWNLKNSALGTATVLTDLAPIFVVILSIIFLKEKNRTHTIAGVFLAFLGIGLLASPKGADLQPMTLLIGIGGAIAGALAYISLKQATTRFSTALVVLTFSIALIPVALIYSMPLSRDSFLKAEWPLFGVIATSLLAQFLMTLSYRILPASYASTLGLTSILWAVIFDFIFLGQRPKVLALIGFLVVVIGVRLSQGFKK